MKINKNINTYFTISKWICIISGFLYSSFLFFATIMVGAAGHNYKIEYTTILTCLLMAFLLLSSKQFQYYGNRFSLIFNWLTIGIIFWVFINITSEVINDYNEESQLLSILLILLPLFLFSIIIIGLIHKIQS